MGGLFRNSRKRMYQYNTGALITHVYNLWARTRFFPECSHATFLIYLSKKNNKNFFIAIFFCSLRPVRPQRTFNLHNYGKFKKSFCTAQGVDYLILAQYWL